MMGISAAAIVFGDISREQVAAAICEAFPSIANDVRFSFPGRDVDYGYIVFPEPGPTNPGDASHRQLLLMPGATCSDYKAIYDGPRTILNLSRWASSTEILTSVLERFGGYLLPSDSESSSDPNNWLLIDPPSRAFEAADPKDRLSIQLAKLVGPALSMQLASLSNQPETLSGVIEAFEMYFRDKQIVESALLVTNAPEMEFNGVGAEVAWTFSAGENTEITLYWELPTDSFEGRIESGLGPYSAANGRTKAPDWLVEHLKKNVSDDPEQTFTEFRKHFADEFPKHKFDDATIARAEAVLAEWAANDPAFAGGPKL